MKKFLILALMIAGSLAMTIGYLSADTIYTNDNKELKGIVVEDYKDRLLFSTENFLSCRIKSKILLKGAPLIFKGSPTLVIN